MANSLALYVTSKSKRATEGLIQNVRRAPRRAFLPSVPPPPPPPPLAVEARARRCWPAQAGPAARGQQAGHARLSPSPEPLPRSLPLP